MFRSFLGLSRLASGVRINTEVFRLNREHNYLSSIARSLGVIEGEKFMNACSLRHFHSSWRMERMEDRKLMYASIPKVDEGADGEKSHDIDMGKITNDVMFPDENTPDLLFDGVRFAELPIVYVQVTKNNTMMLLKDGIGNVKLTNSCGREGFKNARKGTNVAAQATGISLASQAQKKFSIKTVRLVIKGLGPGRMSSVKGLQMGGLDIISISDTTPVPRKGPRPRKPKRL